MWITRWAAYPAGWPPSVRAQCTEAVPDTLSYSCACSLPVRSIFGCWFSLFSSSCLFCYCPWNLATFFSFGNSKFACYCLLSCEPCGSSFKFAHESVHFQTVIHRIKGQVTHSTLELLMLMGHVKALGDWTTFCWFITTQQLPLKGSC